MIFERYAGVQNSHRLSAAGLIVTLGIIYGDIGTSLCDESNRRRRYNFSYTRIGRVIMRFLDADIANHYKPIWFLCILTFVFIGGIFIPMITDLTPEEKRLIEERKQSENFKGIIIDKPYCSHCSKILVRSFSDTIIMNNPDADLYKTVIIGDSIIKYKGDNSIFIKKKSQNYWRKYRY